MSGWHTPPFTNLPPVKGTDYRWVGSRVFDEEQYCVEKLQCLKEGGTTYWRISRVGAVEYGRLRGQRRADRKAIWQARQEGDPEHQDWLDRIVDSAS